MRKKNNISLYIMYILILIFVAEIIFMNQSLKIRVDELLEQGPEIITIKSKPVMKEITHTENITFLGEYTITAYCSCEICCGKYALNRPRGIVYGSSGEILQEGISVASNLPYGTEIIIAGEEYINQDKPADWIIEKYNGMIIDLYFENHDNAVAYGKQVHDVYIKEVNEKVDVIN